MPAIKEIFSSKGNLHELLKAPPKPSFSALRESFLESVEENCSGVEKAAVLFSGGLDSSLVAKAVSERVQDTVLFSVALGGSPAFSSSREAAELLALPLEVVSVKEDALPGILSETGKIILSRNFLQLQIAVPEFIAMGAASEKGFRHVFCGQGADELFFGYDEFRRVLEKNPSFEQLAQLRREKLLGLWQDNLSRDFAVAEHFALELKAPFLGPSFVQQALAFQAGENILSGKDFLRKRVLRRLAEELSLPGEIAWKRKKAIQYDSGISRRLKKLCQ
jgi:asparagine synthase (glutamine-hydrolysing)